MPKKVMIVDDEPHILKAVKLVLENGGFEVATASDGRECLNKLELVRPDLVLVDYFMPEMNGAQLCEEFRRRHDSKLKSVKVAFLTVAKPETVGEEKLRKAHVSDYILKPFDNEDLVQRVKQIVG
jgi:hypothetical protein